MPSEPRPLLTEAQGAILRRGVREVGDRLAALRRGVRGVLLYILPLPLALAALVSLASGSFPAAVAAAAALALVVGGAYLNRRGLVEELVAPERRYTRPSRLPYKYLGAALVGAGTALAAYAAVGQGLPVSLAFGLLAVVGFHLAYGLPRPGVPLSRPSPGDTDRPLRRALEQAEGRVIAIDKAALGVRNVELEQRLRRIAVQGRAILDLIAERPEQLYRARKFLNVYLEGAERVAARYARTHRLARGGELERNFRAVLVEIESVFERQRVRLLDQDVLDLDVQMAVLRQRLEQEGIR